MTERRTAPASSLVLGLLAVGALLLVVAGAHVRPFPVRESHAAPHSTGPQAAPQPRPSSSPALPAAGPHTAHPLAIVVLVIFGLCLALGLLMAGRVVFSVHGGRRWPRLHVGSRARRASGVGAVDLTEELREVVADTLRDLEDGPVADAIVACWQRLVDAVTRAGVRLRASDTPAEVVLRVLGTTPARSEPLQQLAGLYREARFSQHVLGETERAAARAALESVAADLAAPDDGTAGDPASPQRAVVVPAGTPKADP